MMHLSRYSAEREIGFLVILWNMLIEVRDSSREQIRIRKPVLLSLQSDPGEKNPPSPQIWLFHFMLSCGVASFLQCLTMSVHSHRIQIILISKCLSKLIRNWEVMASEIIYYNHIPRSVLCNSGKRMMLLHLEILKWWIGQKARISL